MTLSHTGRSEHWLSLLSPYHFAGELDTYGALEAPSARDFNVMVRRDHASAAVSVHELARGATASTAGEADTWIVYALRGAVAVEIDGEHHVILANESLLASGTMKLAITAAGENATVILVALGPLGRFPALV